MIKKQLALTTSETTHNWLDVFDNNDILPQIIRLLSPVAIARLMFMSCKALGEIPVLDLILKHQLTSTTPYNPLDILLLVKAHPPTTEDRDKCVSILNESATDEQLALFETGTPLSSDKQREFIRLYHLSSSPFSPLQNNERATKLANKIQSYINTNLPEEKETLFDKLREEPRSNEAKAAHTQYITTRLTDHPLLVFATNKYGNTPLHLAAYEGHTAIAKALIDAGANMTATDEDGCTPLHYAACEGKLKTVQALLKAGSNPDTTNNEGYTPLHLAVIKGSRATVDGWTPRQLATNHAIKALLHKAGA